MSNTFPATKVTGLTFHNVSALYFIQDTGILHQELELGKTVATFHGTPAETLTALTNAVDAVKAEKGSRCTEARSLWAVVNKVRKQIDK